MDLDDLKLHVHVWDLDEKEDDPVEELDVRCTDVCSFGPNEGPYQEEADHFQFSCRLQSLQKGDTESIEIRVSIQAVRLMVKELRERGYQI